MAFMLLPSSLAVRILHAIPLRVALDCSSHRNRRQTSAPLMLDPTSIWTGFGLGGITITVAVASQEEVRALWGRQIAVSRLGGQRVHTQSARRAAGSDHVGSLANVSLDHRCRLRASAATRGYQGGGAGSIRRHGCSQTRSSSGGPQEYRVASRCTEGRCAHAEAVWRSRHCGKDHTGLLCVWPASGQDKVYPVR